MCKLGNAVNNIPTHIAHASHTHRDRNRIRADFKASTSMGLQSSNFAPSHLINNYKGIEDVFKNCHLRNSFSIIFKQILNTRFTNLNNGS